MSITTPLTITLTAQRMTELGFVFDANGNITQTPSGLWSSAIWFANNSTDSGYLQLINNGELENSPTVMTDGSGNVTGFKFTVTFPDDVDVLEGGVLYLAVASDASTPTDPFANLSEGEINNLQNAYQNNYTFGTFEFTLTNGDDDQADLTAITTFAFPMSASAIVGGKVVDSVGFSVSGSDIWSAISGLGQKGTTVYTYAQDKGPLSGNAFAITPTTAVGGSFTPPQGKLPFSPSDWSDYLDQLSSNQGTFAKISGIFNGANAPVNNWVSSTNNVQIDVWHNAAFLDYEVSYQENLYVDINNVSTTIEGFLFSPTAASQVKGYVVIPKGNDSTLAPDWNGGLANSIYSTLGMAQLYAQDPSKVSDQTPFLFQNASAANNGSADNPATSAFFNVGANTAWGKLFTLFLPGMAAGYLGSSGTPLNPLDASESVNLSESWNWDPTYAFDQNLASTPYGEGTAFQFNDPYAKIFFQNSNVYGDMYSDGLMSLYTDGSPLLNVSKTGGGDVDEINITVYAASETPPMTGAYVPPVINNYPWSPGATPSLVQPSNANEGTYTLNFINAAGGVGQQSFVMDDSRAKVSVRVWDPTLNNNAGGFSNEVDLPSFPTAQVTVSGFAGQVIPKGTVLKVLGSMLLEEDTQGSSLDWIVQSDTTIPASGGSPTNGSVTLTVTATSADAQVGLSDRWEGLALAFPSAVSASNNAASSSSGGDSLPTVTLQLSGDAGASFDAGYVVDSAGNQWSFAAGKIDPVAGNVNVTATAATSGISVPAGEDWAGLYQYSPVVTYSASVPGIFWSNYEASYENGVLGFSNQNNTGQTYGEMELVSMPLGANDGDIVWYQITVTDTATSAAKTFNFYPAAATNAQNSQHIDGGAAISLGSVTDSYTINFAGSGVNALPGSLFIANQNNGNIPLEGTPFAPVIGTQSSTYYQFLGQALDFAALPNQVTSGSNELGSVAAGAYVFGWTGLNPASLTDGSLQAWSNKVDSLDVVQINIVDTADSTRNQTIFAQGDLDGQWLSGTAATIELIGSNVSLVSKPVSLVAGRTYEISHQEFTPNDSGLSQTNPSGSAPISNASNTLTVSVAGSSGFMDIANSDHHDFVYSLYEGLLDRVPDAEGFRYWAQEGLAASRSNLISSVAESTEFQSKWGVLSDAQFINAAYAFILDRAPDEQGERYWLQALQTQQDSRKDVLNAILQSSEAVKLISDLTDPGYLAMM